MQQSDQPAGLGIAQRAELQPGDRGQPHPFGECGAQRVTAVQVVSAVGREDRNGRTELPSEQHADQVAGGLVRPVHVLHDEQQWRVLTQLAQRPMNGVEYRGPAGGFWCVVGLGRASRRGEEARDRGVGPDQRLSNSRVLRGQPAERLAERKVRRRPVAEVDAVADQHLPAVYGDAAGELGYQPALAGTGVATEEHRPACHVAPTDKLRKLAQLIHAPDQRALG